MLAFSNDYYGMIFRATQSVELFCAYDIYTLFIQDDSISDAKKKNLTPLYKPASSRLLFLAKLISFGMERQFIKRNTKIGRAHV